MDELLVVLREKGLGALTPQFDSEYRASGPDWCIAFEVKDDYGNIVWREAKYGSLEASKPGLETWAKPYGEWDAYPDALKAKIESERTKIRSALGRALTAPTDEDRTAEASAARTEAIDSSLPPETENHDFIPPTQDQIETWDALGLRYETTKRGVIPPPANLASATKILENYPALSDRIWLDEFTDSVMTNLPPMGPGVRAREWTDHDTRRLQLAMQEGVALHSMGFDTAHSAALTVAYKRRRHPVKEWLMGCQWDGSHRVEQFFQKYMGATDSAYARAVSKNFFVAMIARIFAPGCKMDNMVVLEGAQGAKKSSALKTLCQEWFTECNDPINNGQSKDFYSVMQGKMLVEIAELDAFSNADIKRIKAILSTATDRYRPAYGRTTNNYPRTSVFVGTTNEDQYLEDPTGGRRFWPIAVTNIDLELIENDREALFAEALELYKQGATWWEVPREEALKEQELRREVDAWEEKIAHWLLQPDTKIACPTPTIAQVAKGALKIDVEHLDKRLSNRIGNCLKALRYKPAPQWDAATQRTRKIWKKI